MKIKFLTALFFLSMYGFAQTAEKRNNISIGGGKQAYNGDLGNSWFNPEEEGYGFLSASYSRYLTHSFDVTLSVTSGDYGHCRDADDAPVRTDGTQVLNMLSRLTSTVISAKYKFANGYMLKENAKLAPYVFLGLGMNNVTDYFWANKTRVHQGNYGSVNGGVGVRYNFYKNFNFTYNLGFGYFMTDKIDNYSKGMNDAYMQHTFLIGMNF